MKESKNKIIRLFQRFCLNFLPSKAYSFFLTMRVFNKFKRCIHSEKKFEKFSNNLDKINDFEFKITSQNNEDGIIDYIFTKIPNNKTFIEIGVGYYEFNSLNLIKNGWNGCIIEQNYEEFSVLKNLLKIFYNKSNIQLINKSVDKDNIVSIIEKFENKDKIDFFSIDIDGNDYWVLQNIDLSNVSCVCLEYNHWLGNNVKKSIPYSKDLKYIDNGYFGASLLAFNDLMKIKNFKLIAIESSGTNAFFVNYKYSHLFEVLDPIKSFKSTGRLYSTKQRKKIFDDIKRFNFVDV
jgi:hypothetical protein